MWWYPLRNYTTEAEQAAETPVISPRKPVQCDLTSLGHRNWGW